MLIMQYFQNIDECHYHNATFKVEQESQNAKLI